MKHKLVHHTHLTCPFCGFREKLEIPADFCLIFHRCANCNMPIKPAPGDCCIFGDSPRLAQTVGQTVSLSGAN